MKIRNRLAALMLALLLPFCAAACDDSADRRIYFELPGVLATLDPQTASSDAELLIVRNLFEGLLRKQENGEIVPGVAERYEQSGTEYLFYLRENACWDTELPLTADDFVFGLRRAVDPKTKSPFAARLKCIAGAAEILSGAADPSALGVTAIDEHTLRITLAYEDADFLETLTTAPCMPCNEDFFNDCVGKYGLEQKYVLANGSYYLAKWNQTDFGIRIYKNAVYHGGFTARNGGVFLSCNDESTPRRELTDGAVDGAFISSTDKDAVSAAGFETAALENTCWVLTISGDYSASMRAALAMLINREALTADAPAGIRAADSLYPAILGASDTSAAGIRSYDADSGRALFSEAVKKTADRKFPRTTLSYYPDPAVEELITDMIGHWQQSLSAFINKETCTLLDTLTAQLRNPTLQMAVFPVTAKSDLTAEYLSVFTDNTAGTPAEIQRRLLAGDQLIPLCFQETCIAFSDALSGLYLDSSNGYLDFSGITKSE